MSKVLENLTQVGNTLALTPENSPVPTNPVNPPVTLESLQAQIAALTAALVQKTNKVSSRSVYKDVKPESKKQVIINLLNRAEGITNEEAKAILNWPAISLKTQATLLGIQVEFSKNGREKRYFAVTPEAQKAKADAAAAEMANAIDEESAFLESVQAIEMAFEAAE